jgi:ribosome assembly protein YihI (activator of Der GTPase)
MSSKFCPNCDNILDIGKTSPKQQKLHIIDTPTTISESESEKDNVSYIIEKLLNNKYVSSGELQEINGDKKILKQIFTSHEEYKSLNKKDQSFIDKKINELSEEFETKEDESIVAYYVCKKCFFSKKMEKQTVVVIRNSEDNTDSYINMNKFKNAIYNNTLPRTRRFICINKSCPSHKDNDKREAVFYRLPDSTQVYYTCCTCQSYWKGE